MRERRRREQECSRCNDRDAERASHASERFPPANSASPPSTTPIPPTTSATIARVELELPPSELLTSSVGDGVSDDSGPFQSTTDPSLYVCRTPNVYVF